MLNDQKSSTTSNEMKVTNRTALTFNAQAKLLEEAKRSSDGKPNEQKMASSEKKEEMRLWKIDYLMKGSFWKRTSRYQKYIELSAGYNLSPYQEIY